jgi:tetratricopeptide (TPR) repeat protein
MFKPFDLCLELPPEISNLIFSYLPADDLIKAQEVSKSWYKQADDWKLWKELCLHLWKGKQYKNNHKFNFIYNQKDRKKIDLSIRDMKDLLRKHEITYYDCLTKDDFEEKLKLIPGPPPNYVYNYLDPKFGVKRLKETYFTSLRYSHRKFVTSKELLEMQWIMKFKHDEKNVMFLEFFENHNLLNTYGGNLMRWNIVNNGYGVQVDSYPVLQVKRTGNWGWILENNWATLSTVDTERRMCLTLPQSIESRINLAKKVKEEANALFKDGEIENALQLYKTVFYYVKQIPEELARNLIYSRKVDNPFSTELIQLKISTCLNISACFLKLKIYDEALASAQRALRFDANNIKALIRRAQAFMELGNFKRAKLDLDACRLKVKDKTIEELWKKCENELKKEERFFKSVEMAE